MDSLEIGNFYHIYNHAYAKEELFIDEGDYTFFIKKLKKFVLPVCEVFAYCLMPNHFHLVIRLREKYIESEEDIKNGLEVSRKLSHLFNSYAQAYNKKYKRKGGLFQRPFKRKRIESESYLLKLIHYVHYNPVAHGFVNNVEDWKFSSYNSIISGKKQLISTSYIIELFNDMNNFIYCHRVEPLISGIDD